VPTTGHSNFNEVQASFTQYITVNYNEVQASFTQYITVNYLENMTHKHIGVLPPH